jgi:hypothetical protein
MSNNFTSHFSADDAALVLIALPMAEAVTPRRSAARVKLPVSAACVKGRMPWRLPSSIMVLW